MSLRRIVLALSFVAIFSMGAERVSADNLFNNASFESLLEYGDPNQPNWFAFFGAGSAGTFSTLDDGYVGPIDPTDGQHHLSIANDGTAMGFSGVFQSVDGVGDTDYTFSFEARSNSGSTFPIGAEFRVEFFDAGGGLIGNTGNIPIAGQLTDSYQTFGITATSPTGTARIQPVIAVETFSASGAFGNLFVDNASLTAIPEPASAAIIGLAGLTMMIRRRR